MRVITLSCVPLALVLAGCSEKIEGQEIENRGGVVSERPDDGSGPEDGEISGDDVKMQSPVGID
ncbi:hypothetical protein [Sphingopyxis sp.]|uniref:hypothetical protein n=1 Tax=Sphingopyxis sp. TaxID=1908224 RepID=UPI00261D9073|nr:hypothetical protein [Sphingopyxis sp.]MCW0199832.1 hypothetical protein [Sphingopyxis sp.]